MTNRELLYAIARPTLALSLPMAVLVGLSAWIPMVAVSVVILLLTAASLSLAVLVSVEPPRVRPPRPPERGRGARCGARAGERDNPVEVAPLPRRRPEPSGGGRAPYDRDRPRSGPSDGRDEVRREERREERRGADRLGPSSSPHRNGTSPSSGSSSSRPSAPPPPKREPEPRREREPEPRRERDREEDAEVQTVEVELYLYTYSAPMGGYIIERDGQYVGVLTGNKITATTVSANDYAKRHKVPVPKVRHEEVPYPQHLNSDKRSKAYEVTHTGV